MTNTVLAALVAAFVVACTVRTMHPRKGARRGWLSKTAEDFKRGFLEGYRGEPAGTSEASLPALSA